MRTEGWPGLGMTSPSRGPADTLAQGSKQTEPGRDLSGFRRWQPFRVSGHLSTTGGFKGLFEGLFSIHAFQGKNGMPAGRCLLCFSCAAKAFAGTWLYPEPQPLPGVGPQHTASHPQTPWAVVWAGRSRCGVWKEEGRHSASRACP